MHMLSAMHQILIHFSVLITFHHTLKGFAEIQHLFKLLYPCVRQQNLMVVVL